MNEDDKSPSDGVQNSRTMPYNDLDMQFLLTDPSWGREGSAELVAAVSIAVGESYLRCGECKKKSFDDKGFCNSCKSSLKERVIDKKPLWGLQSYYSRDLRLGNLTRADMNSALYYLSLAGDFIRTDNIKSFMTSISRVSDIIELSQSRDGFVRKRFGTITQERIDSTGDDPKKKDLFTNKTTTRRNY